MKLFNFFKYKNPIRVDIHSHLLPGIDDGVRTIEESVAIIKKFKLLGYSKLITTPHVISDLYPNNIDIINQKLKEVQDALKKEDIDIDIEASAEYYVDIEFLKLIEDDDLIPFMGNYILFETAYHSKPMILQQVIYSLQANGYIPVLAHPERYRYLHNDIDLYKELKAEGVLFQVNIKSLQNKSKPIYKIASKLIKLGLVDFMGSDVHKMHDIEKLEKILQSSIYKHAMKNNTILNNN
jgi:tyrosine-protein phosphatase YwqE